jgi:hypothetical protein
MMCLFMAFFSVAMGPICWVGTSEVFATSIRAKVGRSASTLRIWILVFLLGPRSRLNVA